MGDVFGFAEYWDSEHAFETMLATFKAEFGNMAVASNRLRLAEQYMLAASWVACRSLAAKLLRLLLDSCGSAGTYCVKQFFVQGLAFRDSHEADAAQLECPECHPLHRMDDAYSCEMCDDQDPFALVYGCRECDWYLCPACAGNQLRDKDDVIFAMHIRQRVLAAMRRSNITQRPAGDCEHREFQECCVWQEGDRVRLAQLEQENCRLREQLLAADSFLQHAAAGADNVGSTSSGSSDGQSSDIASSSKDF